jgi:hypothetical protein
MTVNYPSGHLRPNRSITEKSDKEREGSRMRFINVNIYGIQALRDRASAFAHLFCRY